MSAERVLREQAERALRSCHRAHESTMQFAQRRIAERDAAQAIVWAVAELRVWTNEDGKRFVFADDLAAAFNP